MADIIPLDARGKKSKKAMVIAPFTADIDGKTSTLISEKQELLEGIIRRLEQRGYDVFSAHRREAWGKSVMPAHECTPLDYSGVRDADLVVAIPGDPASGGTHIEMGWSTAHGRELIVLLEKRGTYSPLVHGLGAAFKDVHYIRYESAEDCLQGLDNHLDNMKEGLFWMGAVRKFAKPLAMAASLLLATSAGYLMHHERGPTLQQSRSAVLNDFAEGLESAKNGRYTKYVGVNGTVISDGDVVVMYPTGWDPSKLRLYGISKDVAMAHVKRELSNIKKN